MRLRTFCSSIALLPALIQAAPRIQAPDAVWITFTTAHYRIHCPKAFEAFGSEVAGRAEGIHAQYLSLVGYVYEKPIDILILDPVMGPTAWPSRCSNAPTWCCGRPNRSPIPSSVITMAGPSCSSPMNWDTCTTCCVPPESPVHGNAGLRWWD